MLVESPESSHGTQSRHLEFKRIILTISFPLLSIVYSNSTRTKIMGMLYSMFSYETCIRINNAFVAYHKRYMLIGDLNSIICYISFFFSYVCYIRNLNTTKERFNFALGIRVDDPNCFGHKTYPVIIERQ